jgi:hypothetical protein
VKASLGTEEEAEKEAEKKKREDGSRGPSFVRLRGSTTAFDLLSELHFCAFCFVLQRYLSLSLSLRVCGGVAHIIALVAWREVSLFLSTCWMFLVRLANSFTLFFHGEE